MLGKIGQMMMTLIILLSALWLGMAIWYHFNHLPVWAVTMVTLLALIAGLLVILLWADNTAANTNVFSRLLGANRHLSLPHNTPPHDPLLPKLLTLRHVAALYTGVWLAGLAWFLSLTPSQNKNWKPEVAHILSYERNLQHPNLVTLHHVRDFDWLTADNAVPRWHSRTVDLSKLSGVDVSNSYWMGEQIAHTLISFRFEDDRPLAFSFEIRKEADESFTALGGFFRRFELSLIASEERDIIYTRTNARGEQVYLFPISNLTQSQVRALFESYLKAADSLQQQPAWYNTLTSNCTNIIYYMAKPISGNKLPLDWRIWASGYLPNYLHNNHLLPNTSSWSMDDWYKNAHINPKTVDFSRQDNQDVTAYSKLIRQGLPEGKLELP